MMGTTHHRRIEVKPKKIEPIDVFFYLCILAKIGVVLLFLSIFPPLVTIAVFGFGASVLLIIFGAPWVWNRFVDWYNERN